MITITLEALDFLEKDLPIVFWLASLTNTESDKELRLCILMDDLPSQLATTETERSSGGRLGRHEEFGFT